MTVAVRNQRNWYSFPGLERYSFSAEHYLVERLERKKGVPRDWLGAHSRIVSSVEKVRPPVAARKSGFAFRKFLERKLTGSQLGLNAKLERSGSKLVLTLSPSVYSTSGLFDLNSRCFAFAPASGRKMPVPFVNGKSRSKPPSKTPHCAISNPRRVPDCLFG